MKIYQHIYLILSLTAIICFNPIGLRAQEHIFTKSISKTINIDKRDIIIDAEKADINISETAGQDLILEIKFISKHTDKILAEKQLDYIKHVINVKNKEVYLRNYILVTAGEELSGSIHTQYILKMPSNKNISISNSMGNITIENIQGNFAINSKYGKLKLNNLKGNLTINAQIGEIAIKDSELKCRVESKYLSQYFYSCTGEYKITSNLGSINFAINNGISLLNIEASGTEITLSNRNCFEFNLSLIAMSGDLFLDECSIKNRSFITSDTRNTMQEKHELLYSNPNINQTIVVKNKFANISIQ